MARDWPDLGRRALLSGAARTAAGTALSALLLGLFARQTRALPTTALRPPGALSEEQFPGSCIHCGLCVRDCPYDTLHLAQLGAPATTGTPYFVARDIPCEMCEDVPCVKACPTGALNPKLTDIDLAHMGTAVLVDQENCLNMRGLRCDVCYRVCPLIDEAISLELQHNERTGHHALFVPTVAADKCTGCGKCEHACVLTKAAIKVLPARLARGRMGEHYRLGWREKERLGHSLVAPSPEVPVRRPESTLEQTP